MKLFLIHCGFYDSEVCDGLYEAHANFFVAATSFDDARVKAKEIPEFKAKKMHVDGLQEVQAVQGYVVELKPVVGLMGQTRVVNHKHRDLAPKPSST